MQCASTRHRALLALPLRLVTSPRRPRRTRRGGPLARACAPPPSATRLAWYSRMSLDEKEKKVVLQTPVNIQKGRRGGETA
jgi:hypothetical protein